MKEYLLIDGYNVINSWPQLKDLLIEDLGEARAQLIDMMSEYQTYRGLYAIIVFDAHLVKGSLEKTKNIKGVKVVYTKEKETADNYIEKFIVNLPKRDRASVVTNDWTEQQMVLGSGGTRIPVRELILDYNNCKRNISKEVEALKTNKDFLSDRIDPITLEKLERFRRKK